MLIDPKKKTDLIGRTQYDSIEPVSGVFFHLFIKMQMRSPPFLISLIGP